MYIYSYLETFIRTMTLWSLEYLHVSLTSSYVTVPETAMISIDVYVIYQKLDSENTQATSF